MSNLKGRLKRLQAKMLTAGVMGVPGATPTEEVPTVRLDIETLPIAVCKAMLQARADGLGVRGPDGVVRYFRDEEIMAFDLPDEMKGGLIEAFKTGRFPATATVLSQECEELRDWLDRNYESLRSLPARDSSQLGLNDQANFRHRLWTFRRSLENGPNDADHYDAVKAVKLLQEKYCETVTLPHQHGRGDEHEAPLS